jgi:hypothetical protein
MAASSAPSAPNSPDSTAIPARACSMDTPGFNRAANFSQ